MTRVHVKGFKIFEDRHGVWRCYHRKTNLKIDLKKAPLGSVEFFAECHRIRALTEAVDNKPKPGTLGLLTRRYRESEAFLGLADRTRADYVRIFQYLMPINDTALVVFTPGLVARIRDKAAQKGGTRFGTYVKQVLSIVFGWGAERDFIRGNPAAAVKGVKRPKDRPQANRPWTDAERESVMTAASAHLRPVLALMMFTGLGPKDAIRVQRSAYRDNEIATRRSKTGQAVFWPAPAELRKYLDDMPRHSATTLCASSLGKPWTQDGLQSVWQRVKHALEKTGAVAPGLTLYGLRHTVAVILREIGYDERTIADALGQKTIEMARHYAEGADLKPKMRGVVQSFDAELNKRRTNSVKPSGENVKP